MVWFVGHYFCTRVYIKFYKILWGVVCLYKSYKYKYQIYFIYFIKSADWFTHFIGFGHFAPSDCVSTKVGWRPTNILSRQGDSNLASLFFVAAWKITWKTGFKWKTASHPEKSGRQPRSRSDGKTTALETSICVVCSIKTKFTFFLFHFLRWHKSETLQVRDQTIVLKSVSMQWLYSLELLLTQRIYCRSQTRLRVKAFIAELYLIETWSTWIKALFWTHGFKIF